MDTMQLKQSMRKLFSIHRDLQINEKESGCKIMCIMCYYLHKKGRKMYFLICLTMDLRNL